MKRFGTHYIVDGWLASAAVLDDAEAVRAALLEAVHAAGATLIELCVHHFSPIGVTATATLAESHIALHTWPEDGYFAADLFFCGSGDPKRALLQLASAMGAREFEIREVVRGKGVTEGEARRGGEAAAEPVACRHGEGDRHCGASPLGTDVNER